MEAPEGSGRGNIQLFGGIFKFLPVEDGAGTEGKIPHSWLRVFVSAKHSRGTRGSQSGPEDRGDPRR